jgi:fatty-acyl-CoA synthase
MQAAIPDPFLTLNALLAHQSGTRPDAIAIRFEGQVLSYRELRQRADHAATALWHRWGVRPGDRVAYLGLNHPDQIALLFALARIGAVLAPLNFRLALPEWKGVLQDCTPVCLVHDTYWAKAAGELALMHDALTSLSLAELMQPAGSEGVACCGQGESPAVLVYTSGTTGKPKGAVHTQANLLANMAAAQAVQAITPVDSILTVLPLFHVGGLCIQTLPALYAGASVILHARFDPDATLADLARWRPSLTLQVPATLRALMAHPAWPKADLSCLRAVWAGSSILPDDLVQAVHARGVPVCNVYGATETGPFSVALPPEHAFGHVGSCGWPAPGVEARLSGQGNTGELWLRAANIVHRYWPETSARDGDGWFHTGDLAQQAADGSYRIVGRAKDMIISGGENIYPAEIENLLARHPLVAECAVLGMPDPQWGEIPVAVVVLHDKNSYLGNINNNSLLSNWDASQAELQAYLQANLARYKLPRRWLQQTELPKTALGKVQKAQIKSLLTESFPAA